MDLKVVTIHREYNLTDIVEVNTEDNQYIKFKDIEGADILITRKFETLNITIEKE